MRPCDLSRSSVSYALPRPFLNPAGVGLCCTMNAYQSITHMCPSGPTCASIGALHSSSLATRFQPYFALKLVPDGSRVMVAVRCPVGSEMNAVRFQYSRGYVRAV